MTDEECLRLFTTFGNETGRIGEKLERERPRKVDDICVVVTLWLKRGDDYG